MNPKFFSHLNRVQILITTFSSLFEVLKEGVKFMNPAHMLRTKFLNANEKRKVIWNCTCDRALHPLTTNNPRQQKSFTAKPYPQQPQKNTYRKFSGSRWPNRKRVKSESMKSHCEVNTMESSPTPFPPPHPQRAWSYCIKKSIFIITKVSIKKKILFWRNLKIFFNYVEDGKHVHVNSVLNEYTWNFLFW